MGKNKDIGLNQLEDELKQIDHKIEELLWDRERLLIEIAEFKKEERQK
jgi:chorismate mutase